MFVCLADSWHGLHWLRPSFLRCFAPILNSFVLLKPVVRRRQWTQLWFRGSAYFSKLVCLLVCGSVVDDRQSYPKPSTASGTI